MKFLATIDGKELAFQIQSSGHKAIVELDGSREEIDYVRLTPDSYSILMGGKSHHLSITEHPDGFKVVIDQHSYRVQIRDENTILLQQFGVGQTADRPRGEVRAPIPGLVSTIFVAPGLTIRKGDKLMILEAMKMENEIQSLISGRVEQVVVSQGQSVEKNSLLVSIAMESHADQ
ncbi:MAG: biotin/lipoyl-containing protein [Fidelibacterota bacterium]